VGQTEADSLNAEGKQTKPNLKT